MTTRTGFDAVIAAALAAVTALTTGGWEPGGGGGVGVEPAPEPEPGEAGVVYLTFDDGPDPRNTPDLLRVLDDAGVEVTFFLQGSQAVDHPDLVQRVRDGGHTIANHTWNHPDLLEIDDDAIAAEVGDTSDLLGGTACVRPPYGSTDERVDAALAATGQAQWGWDVDARDWERPGAQAIVDTVLSQVEDGEVVLLHDGGGDRSQTVEATRILLEDLQARGFEVRPLPGC